MKSNILKVFAIASLITLVGSGVSLADGWKGDGSRGAYGRYSDGRYSHYRYCAPRPVPVVRHYRPVVVRPNVYYPPVVYQAPAPSGYYYGMPPVIQPWVGFSLSMRGH
jgi:hypothetical protein